MREKLRNDKTTQMIVAFAAVYLIWGSTYLAIRYTIETIPPFLMGGLRFLLSGSIMYVWGKMTSTEQPTLEHWRSAGIVGILLFVGGNGALVWAEQYVPSGLAALLLASIPLMMVLLNTFWYGRQRITSRLAGGLMLGFVGMVLLITPGKLLGNGHVDIIGAVVLLSGALSWSIGALYGRSVQLPKSLVLASGMEMLIAGVVLSIISLAIGEASAVSVTEISLKSLLSVFYLVVFGSIVGFTAFAWLLKNTSPARSSTYAYVNPIVAIIIGWAIGGEELTVRTMLAAAIIIGAVVMIITQRSTPSQPDVVSSEREKFSEPKPEVAQLSRVALSDENGCAVC
jgi:drug/metabolite transporter (DMT)-like permease